MSFDAAAQLKDKWTHENISEPSIFNVYSSHSYLFIQKCDIRSCITLSTQNADQILMKDLFIRTLFLPMSAMRKE